MLRLVSNSPLVAAPAVPLERRRMPRISTVENGGLVPVDLAGSAGLLLDVSPSGLLVHSLDRLAVGSRINVGLWVAGSETRLLAGAHVVWSDEEGRAGLDLIDPPPQWASRITELLGGDRDAGNVSPSAPEVSQAAPPCPALPPPQSLLGLEPASAPTTGPTQPDFVSFVEQALSITEADGAALALLQNDDIYCVASLGRAPAVGARLNPVSGISGECYRTARAVVCNDAEHDVRISPEAARRLNLRSLAVVPVLHDGKSIGLLQVLSQRAAAFSDVHLELLDYIAEQAALRVDPAPVPHPPAEHTPAPASPSTTPDRLRLQDLSAAAGLSDDKPSVPLGPTEPGNQADAPADWVPRAQDASPDNTPLDPQQASALISDEAPTPSFAMVSSEGSKVARWALLVLLLLALAGAAVWYFKFADDAPAAVPLAAIAVAHATAHSPASPHLPHGH